MAKLRISFLAVLACAGLSTPGHAEEERSGLPVTPLEKLMRDPRAFYGRPIHLSGAACVDPGKSGFVCVLTHKGRPVRVTASALGADTVQDIAEDLIGPCKGTANLGTRECKFDIQITPVSSDREMVETTAGGQQVISIYSAAIEMYRRR